MRSDDSGKGRMGSSAPTPQRDAITTGSRVMHGRRPGHTHSRTWSETSMLERMLAADRDDPTFDYAAH
jgi:hypothetical protein